MEFPLGKPFEGNPSEPLNLIVQASLGIEQSSIPFKGSRRTFFHPSDVFDKEVDVQYEVIRGTGTLEYFDKNGKYVSSRVLEPGANGTLLAGENYRYAPTHGLIVILESDDGKDDSDILDL